MASRVGRVVGALAARPAAAGDLARRLAEAEDRADRLAEVLREVLATWDPDPYGLPALADVTRWRAVLDANTTPDGGQQ